MLGRERWLAILANFLKAHRALGLFLERKSQVHRGHGYLSSARLGMNQIVMGKDVHAQTARG